MFQFGKKVENVTDLKEIEPYNQADMYVQHCDMLISFGNAADRPPKDKKRSQKLKRKLTTKALHKHIHHVDMISSSLNRLMDQALFFISTFSIEMTIRCTIDLSMAYVNHRNRKKSCCRNQPKNRNNTLSVGDRVFV